ncbi:cytochrome P450 2U1 [Seriola lalandi dorsalis]|uniref:Cytochrome P450 2U1 n=1 Tax=Seriola lalandi dorsalis TaxID=1841481 RepID=A0A3B4YIT2_SERLL|nr:cytochrome P450 2U1 [Seriola lalandi dorsalis]XP_056227129.1 cytochrome P450 2U1 [Seriola aureovittata]
MFPLKLLEQMTSSVSHVNIVSLIVFLLVYYLVRFYQKQRYFANIPPGPKPWPVVGNFGGFIIPSFIQRRLGRRSESADVMKNALVILTEQANIYGNVYSLFVGSQLIVVLNGYEVVKDALSNHPEVFSDRPDIPAVTIMTKRKGIVFAPYGPIWKKQRKFCHTILRNFGLGKLSFEPCILQGLATIKTELLRQNETSGGAGVNLAPLISNAVSNVICSMILGQRFHHEDREFRTLLDLMERGLEICVNSPAVLINIFPLLYYLPFGVFKELRQVEGDITSFLKRIIAKHQETLDPENPRDLVDMYLMEMLAQQAAGEKDSSFTDDYLFYIVGDLFIAGTDTTANSILWILLYMVLYPDIQDMVQAEIDEVVGRHRGPSMTDKGSLPFTEATIMEVQRLTVVVPLGIPHMASKTTVFRGHTIPKGTVILPNLWSVHRDPTLWEDPDGFNPARFLDDEGKLLRKECFIPFGIGRRVCMGEQLAKMELFLTVTSLLQAFKFRLPEGKPPPPLHGRFGLTLSPCPYTVCVSTRR